MANQGYELTAAQTMNKARPPATRSVPPGTKARPPATRAVPPGNGAARPPSRTNGSGNSAVRKAPAGTGAKKGSGGPKQTAKKRAMQRAMTPEQRAARKKQSIIGGITTGIILIGCGAAIWYFALGAPTTVEGLKDGLGTAVNNTKTKIDSIGDVLDNLDGIDWGGFFKDDPWEGNTTVTLWNEKYIKRNDGGLTLTLVNSLTAEWQKEFEVAVADWSESDALTLSVEILPVEEAWSNEKKCARQGGKQVVCNGFFGETGWVGINENEVSNNRIISSVAKMNEFYLRNANFYHRRFTMCHELGHGFGLPHTDENPYNRNQGNCLDYTDDPEENLLPGEVNFIALKEVYLAQEPTRRLLRRVDNNDGTVTETIGWLINEDKFAEAWGL
ncbi:hypothetical protein QTG54_000675 [Skeletonema marinoi]|uniref:Peptidase M10 metallopeptidase domain-containing protein n=1 Tax=Skeletonema marinoi TaxID=267567 RepID=A0AAD9DI61_9STRA|nr:hypothetical protein QTG54_000675 [Skeletonema marinoi]|mmetsp:Transcript_16379/g.27672  ORF Transcript_16379/g.27672 Transcript_16379/m.27672 type:complete len:387 (-) Transcript_16379:1762-2922(-)